MAVAAPSVVDVSAAHVASVRAKYPFLDDLIGHSSLVETAGS
jgi:hypothetical protein